MINGIVLIRVNTGATVEPLVQEWPGRGDTGESLLVRREGNHLAFLNNTRYFNDSALKVSVPVASLLPESFMLDAKEEGIVEGIDYRGTNVLLAFRYVPLLKWGLIVKQDTSEAFKPIVELKNQIITLTVASMLIIVILVFVFSPRNYTADFSTSPERECHWKGRPRTSYPDSIA